ncbi:hypothetical protein [Streptomonospora nanhaiensis]|uniref:hypothetical protein n=1 Tax=Streptomonospora nanhaiensis TaxID=1323731 RepID=UPI001C395B79|nr:hypothetical protein [Streptomonospora nanhaiensis]MBV2367124.1 hypothetical protein [Streptomonospora nanhaiensis]
MDEQQTEMSVLLVGGPADWSGRRVQMPVPADPADAGAYLISSHTPDRGDGQDEAVDIDPRAVYTPDDHGDLAVWHFRGWFPADPRDPAPEDYLASEGVQKSDRE